LIAPNLVLTARHCVETVPAGAVNCAQTKFTPPKGNQDVVVSTSTNLHGSVPYFQVSQVHVPPDGSSVCGNDIALLVLAQPFPASTLRPIAVQLDSPVGTGDAYTAIGFGQAAVAGTEGVRRSKSGLSVVCASSNCASQGIVSATEFVGADSICEGDSGGPAIDSEGSVIGIVSRGADNCGLAIYSAVAPWGSWIDDVAKAAAQLGQYTLPNWFGGSSGDTASSVTAGSGTIRSGTDGNDTAPVAANGNAAPSLSGSTNPSSSDGTPAVGPTLTKPQSQASTGGGCDIAAPGHGAAGGMPAGLACLIGLGWITWRRRAVSSDRVSRRVLGTCRALDGCATAGECCTGARRPASPLGAA